MLQRAVGSLRVATQPITRSCIVPLWNEPYNLSGRGCIVAVIDSGIDWKHPDFTNDDGSTRILKLWDQTVNYEVTQVPTPSGYVYGSEYTKELIDEALTGNEAAMNSLSLSRDYSGHGTFVTGIAAGNGKSSNGRNRGVAYEAELIIVKLGESLENEYPRTTRLMEAVNYVINQAVAYNKPIAINLSFGNNQGSHDGTDLLSSYLSLAANVWKSSIVCGTGNEAGAGIHTSGLLTDEQGGVEEWAVGAYQTAFNLQLWKDYSDEFELVLTAPGGQKFRIIREGTITDTITDTMRVNSPGIQRFQTQGTNIYVYYGEPKPYSAYQQIYFEFIPKNQFVDTGIWTVELTPVRIVNGRYDMWLPASSSLSGETRFLAPDENVTLTVPSAADKVISVGAYNSRTDAYAFFSGRGFTRENSRIKPDIVAPGVDIVSTAVGGGYSMRSGTSMAAPFVTGSAALMMEWGIVNGNDAYLYGEKIRAYLIKGARRLAGDRVFPNQQIGWGALCLRNSLVER